MRFHVLGIPHTVSTPEYSTCAFTQKVVKLCQMLHSLGHHVTHYGHEASQVECDEHVVVTTDADLKAAYGDHNWITQGWPPYRVTDAAYLAFNANTIEALKARLQPNDFLLCPFGTAHQPVASTVPAGTIVVESGIGYPGGTFAPYRVFESYAIMSAYQGLNKVAHASNDFWYDVVIPNAFDLSQFEYSETHDDYLLFLGRVNVGKGAHIARQVAVQTDTRLIVAGAGDQSIFDGCKYAEVLGPVGPEERKKLLSRAKAVLCPSTFLEPFCGVQIEAMLSGAPVISSDWGAFAEYNLQCKTGFRCRTFSDFIAAVKHTDTIKRRDCRAWAEQFSLDNVAPQYDRYFKSVSDIYTGKGWYA